MSDLFNNYGYSRRVNRGNGYWFHKREDAIKNLSEFLHKRGINTENRSLNDLISLKKIVQIEERKKEYEALRNKAKERKEKRYAK